jgi:hypothetical protein
VLRIRPDDGPSRVLMARCLQYQETPPEENWDGVRRWADK